MKEVDAISKTYFDYIAKRYPVMCASDEFYFFPRAVNDADSLDSLDSLDREKIEGDVSRVRSLKQSLERIDPGRCSLDERIDITLLRQSMSTFLREFAEVYIWRTDPAIYLKVALLGIDHLKTRLSPIRPRIDESIASRLKRIPHLLNEGCENLTDIPLGSLEVALEMLDASIEYFKTSSFPGEHAKKVLRSLGDFRNFLKKKSPKKAFVKGRGLLESILKDSFSCGRALEEIFEIASSEYRETLKSLDRLSKDTRPEKNWREVLSDHRIEAKGEKGLLALYSDQIERIKKFLVKNKLITIPETKKIKVKLTPLFLKPVRASASYNAPLTRDSREPVYFYVTDIEDIHTEYMFVTAHETYPGHHLLDSVRRNLKNPVRQKIESALFYEGWASYAETLLDSAGYVKSIPERLPGLRRQAWRAVRAMLDVGVRIGKLSLEDAGGMLKDLGYGAKAVRRMLRHYLLTPGYQLCYTIGKFEIERLKKRFSARVGPKKFHDALLADGEIPFDLLEIKMEGLSCKRNF